MKKIYCDICEEENPQWKVYCTMCKKEHTVCSMCHELGHNYKSLGIDYKFIDIK